MSVGIAVEIWRKKKPDNGNKGIKEFVYGDNVWKCAGGQLAAVKTLADSA